MAKVLNLGAKASMGNEKCTRYGKREGEQVDIIRFSVFGRGLKGVQVEAC